MIVITGFTIIMEDDIPSKKLVKSCTTCKARMSSKDFDSHLICIRCRGSDCNLDNRCDVCRDWSPEHMTLYVHHQTTLSNKRASKEKAKASKVKSDGHSKEDSLSGIDSRVDSDDLVSSASGISSQEVEKLIGDKLSGLKDSISDSIHSDLDRKLEFFWK